MKLQIIKHKILRPKKKVDDSNNSLAKKLRFGEIIRCNKCRGVCKDKKLFKYNKKLEHKDSETEDGDYTCEDCPFPTNIE